jgi:diguanylate cyclase (GGDEF)-like protein
VVDDDVSTRASLLAVLAGAGIAAIGAASAEQALAFHAEQAPGLAVIDYNLPDADGLELAQALKEREPTLPVLLLTGHASLESAIAAVGQVDGYLLKPMATETFIEAVRRGLAQGALVAENRNLASRLERLSQNEALYDPLTGLPNRALLDDRINQALAIIRRNHSTLAILFIDLDGFKAVNDLFGHHVGDLALRELANRLAEARRRTDTIARFGGDEFVVVCPDVESVDVAFRIAEVILAELARTGSPPPSASSSPSPAIPTSPPTSSCAMPIWPCTAPRTPGRRAGSSSTRPCGPGPPRATKSSRASGWPWSRTSWSSSTNRSSTSVRVASSAPRLSSAGTGPVTESSLRRSS